MRKLGIYPRLSYAIVAVVCVVVASFLTIELAVGVVNAYGFGRKLSPNVYWLAFFSAFLIHQSGNNITNNIRWSVQLRYNNLDEPTFIERGYPMAYIYKPETELVTPNFPTVEQLKEVFS